VKLRFSDVEKSFPESNVPLQHHVTILQKENKGWKSTVGFHCFYSSKLLDALYNFDVSSDTPGLHPG